MTKHEALKTYFGHSEFRSGQEIVIDSILSGRDVLCVMPTGAGKSVCYQVPAIILSGITLVVSPLISLMKDQVRALKEMGIAAAFLNSTLTPAQYNKALFRAKTGCYKIIYVAPERILTQSFLDFVQGAEISLVAVDEAHCVSQWGQDFRPSYSKISEFISMLPQRPVVGAFTATATAAVKEDVEKLLQLDSPYGVTTGFDRKNLYFAVRTPPNKDNELLKILDSNRDSSSIVYCLTRKSVENVCETLCSKGFSATRYHAGLEPEERRINQEDFIYDRKQIMVATNAFGMGIDKSNVSFVIHYNMPKNLESYYQEAGRAGRDGEPAQCILLYSGSDVKTNLFLIDKSEENSELDEGTQEMLRERDRERLKTITFYCTTNNCLREYILRYFGDNTGNFCGNCSNCENNFEAVDITIDAQKILSCVARLNQRFGVKMICDILRGSKNERIKRLRLNELSTYGIMSKTSEKSLRSMINFLVMEDYISSSSGEYPTLSLTEKSEEILKDKTNLTMKMLKEAAPAAVLSARRGEAQPDLPVNRELFLLLKELRGAIARRRSVPAYVIFSDATLRDMCRKLPETDEQFLEVSGVGSMKLKQYGEIFMQAINDWQENE